MTRLWIAFLLAASVATALAAAQRYEECYYVAEQTSGDHRICSYRCPSGDAAITVSRFTSCPLNIKRPVS